MRQSGTGNNIKVGMGNNRGVGGSAGCTGAGEATRIWLGAGRWKRTGRVPLWLVAEDAVRVIFVSFFRIGSKLY